MDFYAAILHALRGANWQRGGGKGEQPEMINRPREDGEDSGEIGTADELAARKQAFYDHMERRRNMVEEADSG